MHMSSVLPTKMESIRNVECSDDHSNKTNVKDEYKCICISMHKMRIKIYAARTENERFIFQSALVYR